MALLRKLLEERVDEFVFPGGKKGRPLSNMALITLLHRMGRRDIVPHGFRSTFRDWAAEQTSFAREVPEMALAHAIENKVEAASANALGISRFAKVRHILCLRARAALVSGVERPGILRR